MGKMAASKRLPDWLDEVYIGHVGKMAASKRLPDWLDQVEIGHVGKWRLASGSLIG